VTRGWRPGLLSDAASRLGETGNNATSMDHLKY
jgi:hypothetical protein